MLRPLPDTLKSGGEPEFHFEGNQGDVIWVGFDPDCKRIGDGHYGMFLWLMDPSGQRVDQTNFGCEFGRRELPATGTYTFKGVFKYKDDIVRYRVPIRFIRHNRQQQVSYGQMVSGIIEQRPAHDVYMWTAQQGDLIVLSGQGCELGTMVTVIWTPDGNNFLGPGCRVGTYFKIPKDGVYRLVVNGDNSYQPGPYHFVFQGRQNSSAA